MKLLFICMLNLQRSPTAEDIFKDKHETKSAGLDAGVILTKAALEWADIVFVMEDWMRKEIGERFPKEYHKKIVNLDIPDMYMRMQPELVELLKKRIMGYLK